MRTAHLILLCTIGFSGAIAQTEVLVDRHARIAQLQREEAYDEVVKLIELQVRQAMGNAWQDSIHTYVYGLGRAVWRSRKDADAGIAAARALNDQVQRVDKDDLHRLNALEALGELLFDLGRMQECVLSDSMAMVFADTHHGIPLIRRGRVLQRLGLDYGQMGDHARSLIYYLKAREQFGKSDTLLAALMAETSNGIGAAYWHLGEDRRADTAYTAALGYWEKSKDPRRDFRMVGTLINRGILWQGTGDYSRCKANYLEAIRRSGAVADTARDPALRDEAILARTRGYVNLATVYFSIGDDGRTRELLEMALHDREKILEPDDPKLLGVKDRLADVELEAGNYAKAEKWVRDYLEACEKYYGPRSEEYVWACAKLGEVYAGLDQPRKADSLFTRSIALSEAMENSDTDTELASAYQRHAMFYIKIHRYVEAMAELERALAIVRRVHGDRHYKVATYELLLAEAAFANNDPAATLHYADHALELVQDRVVALRASSIPRTWPQPHLLSDALYWKVKAERALGMQNAEQWRSHMDLSILAMERNKAAYDDEGSQLGFIGQQKVVFDQAIDLAGESYAKSGALSDLDRFLAIAEADRTVLLKSRLNDFTGMQFVGVPDSVIVKENQLLSALTIDPEDRAATADLAKREGELRDFLERLSKSYPRYFQLRYGEPSVSIADLRAKLLTPTRDLLLYAFTGDQLHILMVGADTAALLRVPSKEVDATVKALNAAIQARDQPGFILHARSLYTMVFQPVAALLQKPELLIIPDGALQTVNFETLLFKDPEQGKVSDHLLIHRYAIAYLLSATTAVQFKGLASSTSHKALAFAPGFSDELKQEYLANVQDTALIDQHYLRLVRQPFAIGTAQGLGSMMNARVSIGAEASERHFREQARENGILHLGTHAEMNAASPLYSRLVFSKDGSGVDPDGDGYLHAYEIYEMDLRAQLAVLTACETGTGAADAEGVRSLGYSFAYAGCPSLVTSLWSIDEKVSSEIIERFYEHLANGLPKHEALRQAKLDHLASASEELRMPFYWAGLVLMGDVEPVKMSSSKRFMWWGLGGVAVIAAIAARRKRKERTR